MHKLKILLAAICGELLKLYYKVGLGTIPYGINQEKVRKEKVIVSLTKGGRDTPVYGYFIASSNL